MNNSLYNFLYRNFSNFKIRIIFFVIFFTLIFYFLLSFKYYIINVFDEKQLVYQKIIFSNNTYNILKNIFENYNTNNYNNSIDIHKKVIVINLFKKSYKEVVVDNRYKYVIPVDFNLTKSKLISYINDIIYKDFNNSSNHKKIKYKIHKFDFIKDKFIYVYLLNSTDFYFGNKKITIYYYKDEKNLKNKIISNLKTYISKNLYNLVNLKNIELENIKSVDILDKQNEYELVSFNNEDMNKYYQLNIKLEVSYKKSLGYNTIYRYTNDLPLGFEKVLIPGKNGVCIVKEIRSYISYDDYDILSFNEIIIKKPVDRVILIGTKELKLDENQVVSVLEMEATGYTAGVGNVGYYTATGHRVKRGIVAVDPNVIKLGTKLYIEGYGYAVALDKGSAIKGNIIDLYFESYEEAISWGRRKVKVFILK